jgi:hypothetical protein
MYTEHEQLVNTWATTTILFVIPVCSSRQTTVVLSTNENTKVLTQESVQENTDDDILKNLISKETVNWYDRPNS